MKELNALIEINNKTYKVVESKNGFDCTGCALYNKTIPCNRIAEIYCSEYNRSDKKNVILIEK